ncbi:hypothetical protein FOMPIDRAFT_91690, partial [Fomitopsis schrenkii]
MDKTHNAREASSSRLPSSSDLNPLFPRADPSSVPTTLEDDLGLRSGGLPVVTGTQAAEEDECNEQQRDEVELRQRREAEERGRIYMEAAGGGEDLSEDVGELQEDEEEAATEQTDCTQPERLTAPGDNAPPSLPA